LWGTRVAAFGNTSSPLLVRNAGHLDGA